MSMTSSAMCGMLIMWAMCGLSAISMTIFAITLPYRPMRIEAVITLSVQAMTRMSLAIGW